MPGEQQLTAVPSVRDKLEKLIESITEKFGEASSSVNPEVVNMLRERQSVVVSAQGASPSTTSEIENKGGFGTVRERKRLKFVPYQPEEEQYYDLFFSINFEGDEQRKRNPFSMIDSIAECTGMKPKRIFGMNKTSVSVEVHNGEHL